MAEMMRQKRGPNEVNPKRTSATTLLMKKRWFERTQPRRRSAAWSVRGGHSMTRSECQDHPVHLPLSMAATIDDRFARFDLGVTVEPLLVGVAKNAARREAAKLE